jgi:hypothetical protein
MTYRKAPEDIIPETPTMQWRRIGRWFAGGLGIGGGAALVVALCLLLIAGVNSGMSDYWKVTLAARGYVHDVFREARFAATQCANAENVGWRCDVFIRWPDRSEFRRLLCAPDNGCREERDARRACLHGSPGCVPGPGDER